MSLYYMNVAIHVAAALFWLGGMFFIAAVGAPVLRRIESPALRAELFRSLGTQFRWTGWLAIATLVATGFGNLYFRGFLAVDTLRSGQFWATPYGRTLAWKLGLVMAMLAIQAVHDFRHGPAASRLQPGSEAAVRFRRRASLLARLNATLGLLLVYVAVRLARGG